MKRDSLKREKRMKRKERILAKIRGTSDRPRLSVFRSHKYLSVQLIDDTNAKTIASARISGKNIEKAKTIGSEIAKLAAKKKIQKIVFDRGGYRYHGSIKALADAAREGGLQF